MAGLNECPECGNTLPIDSPQGLCPRCLLNRGLENEDFEAFELVSVLPWNSRSSVATGLAVNGEQNSHRSPHETQPGCDLADSSLFVASEFSRTPGAANRYQLFGEIARGGMGAILRGRDPELGRDLAFKVLLEQHRDDPVLVRRFIEEARISGQLQHPGIVPVHELGAFADQRPYFTMKLVMGRTLAELLAGREHLHVDRPRFLGIFEQVCQTMSYTADGRESRGRGYRVATLTTVA